MVAQPGGIMNRQAWVIGHLRSGVGQWACRQGGDRLSDSTSQKTALDLLFLLTPSNCQQRGLVWNCSLLVCAITTDVYPATDARAELVAVVLNIPAFAVLGYNAAFTLGCRMRLRSN
jgi:hypothetical protein